MGRAFTFVGLLIVVGVGLYFYSHQAAPAGGAPTAKASIDLVGVKSDLLMLANAERGQLALEGKYATLDDLVAKGSVPAGRTRRPPYSYSAEIDGAAGFRITATYQGPPDQGAPQRVTIDQTMQVRTE